MKKILLFFFIFIGFSAQAQDSIRVDSTLIKKSWIVVPIGYYQPETSVALGIAGGYYFESHDIQHISSISYSVIYTFNQQFMLHIAPKIYSKDKKTYFSGDVGVTNYPDYYYGIGNTPKTDSLPFIAKYYTVSFQLQRYISRSWLVGLQFAAKGETMEYNPIDLTRLQAIYSQYGNAGWSPYFMLGVGASVSYNTRDNFFYPKKGIFAKLSYLHYPKLLGSSYEVSVTNFDFRQYIPLWKEHIFAYQVLADAVLGSEIPFQMLPTLGGRDVLRGFREEMYRDNFRVLLQAEYRLPIYKRLKMAVFGSVGDVFNATNPQIDKLKVSYGVGLRYRLNQANVHLRVDYARTNYLEIARNYYSSGFYITASEAF